MTKQFEQFLPISVLFTMHGEAPLLDTVIHLSLDNIEFTHEDVLPGKLKPDKCPCRARQYAPEGTERMK